MKKRIKEIEDNTSDVSEIQISEFKDILNWIPELAADSDLDHKQWNEVNSLSQKMKDMFQNIENLLKQKTDIGNQVQDFVVKIDELDKHASVSQQRP